MIVCRLDGKVIAGGVGLVTASDIVISTERTKFLPGARDRADDEMTRDAGARRCGRVDVGRRVELADSSVGDISGTPRLRSLKRVVPQSISRRISAVQREQMISAAIATGQNCP